MSPSDNFRPALAREWAMTRIILIAGFALAIGIGAYVAFAARHEIVAMRAQIAARIAAQTKAEAQLDAVKDRFCPAGLAAAKALGALPAYTVLAETAPRPTNIAGRYLCVARTQVALYGVVADLACTNLADGKCLSVYGVTQGGKQGGVIYQRGR